MDKIGAPESAGFDRKNSPLSPKVLLNPKEIYGIFPAGTNEHRIRARELLLSVLVDDSEFTEYKAGLWKDNCYCWVRSE